jgi:hypothetical protein
MTSTLPAERPPVAAPQCSCCGRPIHASEASYVHIPGKVICFKCGPRGVQWDYRSVNVNENPMVRKL